MSDDWTLIDALLADAEEHQAAGRVLQAANARAAAENLKLLPPWNGSGCSCPVGELFDGTMRILHEVGCPELD